MATVKLTELMKERQLLSFELFPPKTDKGMENLPGTIEHLCHLYVVCLLPDAKARRRAGLTAPARARCRP